MTRLTPLLILFSILTLNLISCQDEVKPKVEQASKKRIEFSSQFEKLEVFENYVQKIDDNKTLERVQSLFYTDSDGNTSEAIAWINKKMEIVKLKQTDNLTNGKKTEQTFYFLNGLKTFSRKNVFHYELKKPYFTEHRSYYSLTGSVIATFGRYSTSENVASATLEVVEKQALSHQKALAIIKRTGDFETRFRGFDEAFGRKYIVVGTDKQTSTVAFNVESPLLKQLMGAQERFKNKLLEVQFSSITEPDGFTFQALIDLNFPS